MEQGNVAKKLTGQILENWLLSFADGHGGIQTITKTTTSGLVDTYTITFSDTTTSKFTVTNGRSISNVTTSKSGKVTTVTISYNDGTSSSFTVRDGENVTGITEYWAVSTSGSSQPQSGWQTTPPTMTSTYKYLWHYSQYTYSDNTTTATTPAVQGVYGDKGDTGNTGTSITSVTKTGTSGLVDTYTITFSNGTTTTFQVTNGSEIESIEKTSTAGLVDTYTVTMGSGDTHTFTVTNGRSIVSFTQTSGTHAAGTIDVYTMTYNDGDTSQIQVYNGANGTGAVSTVAGIGVSSAEGDVPLIIKGYGAPTTATVGQVNQLYFDMTGGIMYICISTTGGSYDWRGMSSAVDSAMSTTSANPLQNRVISNKVGVGSLSTDFDATNLTDAANELQTNKANLASPTFTGTPKAPTAAAGTNNTQLATTAFVQNIASDLNGAIKFFLQSTGDTTDRSAEILAKLNNYGVCYLADGEFYINAGVTMPNNTSIFGMGAGTKVILANNASSQFVFNVGSYCTVSDLTIIGNSTELPYSSYTQGTRKAIQLIGDYSDFNTGTYSHNFAKLSNLTIQDFNHSGIWAYKNDGAASFLATNIDILRCHTGINIELFSEFHSFSNIRCRFCNIACVMQGGNNLFSNCHFDTNLMGIKIDGTNNTLVNADHSSFTNCTVCHPDNNTGYAVWLSRSLNGLLFSNCQFWYGKIYIDTCSGVKFNQNIFGGTNSNVTITSSNKTTFTNNLFKETSPSVTITSCLKLIWENNQNGNGDLIIAGAWNKGSTSNWNSSIIQSGIYNDLYLQNVGICITAGEFTVVIPLPFMINNDNATYTLTRVVLLGKGQIPDTALSNIPVTFQPTYVRVNSIPWASAQVGDVCIVDVKGNLSFN